jgi:hypothetical protein
MEKVGANMARHVLETIASREGPWARGVADKLGNLLDDAVARLAASAVVKDEGE